MTLFAGARPSSERHAFMLKTMPERVLADHQAAVGQLVSLSRPGYSTVKWLSFSTTGRPVWLAHRAKRSPHWALGDLRSSKPARRGVTSLRSASLAGEMRQIIDNVSKDFPDAQKAVGDDDDGPE